MKIAVSGKGGVGKTTICAVWAQLFAENGFDVLAIDADPTTNLSCAFGIPSQRSPEPIIRMKELIAERTGTDKNATGAYFRMNPEVSDLPEKYWIETNGVKLLVLGGIHAAGAGCACPEGAFLKAMLTHIILRRQEVILVDLAAGLECMGRSSITGTDVLVIVVEPGRRSIETALNISEMADGLGIRKVAAMVNKVTEASQVEAIKAELPGIPVLGSMEYSPVIQRADLQRDNVFETCPELVQVLRQAKENLTALYASNTEVSSG